MKLFLIKSILISCLCFLCVLLGMQLSNNGMDGRQILAPMVQAENTDTTRVLGEEVAKGKSALEQLQHKNFFSKTGDYVTDVTEKAVSAATEWSGQLVQKVKEMSR